MDPRACGHGRAELMGTPASGRLAWFVWCPDCWTQGGEAMNRGAARDKWAAVHETE